MFCVVSCFSCLVGINFIRWMWLVIVNTGYPLKSGMGASRLWPWVVGKKSKFHSARIQQYFVKFFFFFFFQWFSVPSPPPSFLPPVIPMSWFCSTEFRIEQFDAILPHFVFLSITRLLSGPSFSETSYQISFWDSVSCILSTWQAHFNFE